MQVRKLALFSNWVRIRKDYFRTVTTENIAVKVSEKNIPTVKSWKEIPGPSSLPIIGTLHHFLPGGTFYGKNISEITAQLYTTYGPIAKVDGILGRPPFIFLFDAKSTEQILRGENSLPERPAFDSLRYYRKHYKKIENENQQTGLLTDNGEKWKDFRSKTNQIMLQPKTIKLYKNALEEVARDMIARIRYIRDEKNMIQEDFGTEINLWALESIGTVAFGCRLNCFDPNLAEDAPAKKLIRCVHDTLDSLNKLEFEPSFWRQFPTPAYRDAMRVFEEQSNLTKYFISKALEELKSKNKNSEDEKGILEKLLEIDENAAHVMASDMLLAGVDTAANTMAATLYFLARNQEKQNKLREELKSNQEKQSYLKACIKESIRMMPVVPGNLRIATKEYNVLGYKIPKGFLISFANQYMTLMEEHYPKPKEYIPERWLVDKNDPLYHGNANPFVYLPFGFGVRSCIGRRIAELELEVFLVEVMENFQLDWIGPPPNVASTALNYIQGPFNYIFKDI